MNNYLYKLDVFEGPLELLLHLIEKHKIDIYDIPIVSITSQYMEYLHNWNHFDINYSSEFLVMAATLLQIKSRLLLPKQAEPMEEDPRDELVAKLIEFKEIKHMTELIALRTDQMNGVFTRPEDASLLGTEAIYHFEVGRLYQIFQDIYDRFTAEVEEPPKVLVEKESYSLETQLVQVRRLLAERKKMSIRSLWQMSSCREELVVTFLAVLELLKFQILDLQIAGGQSEDLQIVYRDVEG